MNGHGRPPGAQRLESFHEPTTIDVVPFYDTMLLGGLALWTVGTILRWTQPLSILELALGEDLREAIGGALRRIGAPLAFIGAFIQVVVRFT